MPFIKLINEFVEKIILKNKKLFMITVISIIEIFHLRWKNGLISSLYHKKIILFEKKFHFQT